MEQQTIEKLDIEKTDDIDEAEQKAEELCQQDNLVYMVETSVLMQALKLVEKSFSKEGSGDNVSNGVLVKLAEEKITFCATNGTKTSRYIIGEIDTALAIRTFNPGNTSVVINGKEVERAVKILKTSTEKNTVIEHNLETRRLHLYSGEIQLDLNTVKSEAPFPKVDSLMDVKFTRKMFFDRAALLDLLKSSESKYVEFKVGSTTEQPSIDEKTFESVNTSQVVLKCHSGNAQEVGATQMIMPAKL